MDRGILFKGEMVRAILNTTTTFTAVGEPSPIDPTRPYKNQTRRVIKFPATTWHDLRLADTPHHWAQSAYEDGGGNWIFWSDDDPGNAELTKKAYPNGEGVSCPYGRVGDTLWVREAWRVRDYGIAFPEGIRSVSVSYRADGQDAKAIEWLSYTLNQDEYAKVEANPQFGKWRPSLFMPRWASRLHLTVVSVTPQRLQAITEADAVLEGIKPNWLPGVPGWSPAEHGYYDYSLPEDWDGEGANCLTAVESYAALWNSINAHPKPMNDGRTKNAYYISYPWEEIRATEVYKGRPHYIIGNPLVWRIEFTRQ